MTNNNNKNNNEKCTLTTNLDCSFVNRIEFLFRETNSLIEKGF